MTLFIRRAIQPDRYVVWVALWTVLFVILNRAPILGRGVPIWDARDSFFPFFVLAADHARAGQIVSWDVWSNGGLPRIGDAEFGSVWPLQLAIGLIFGGTPMGFIAYWMLVWWLGGLGMFLLARHLRAPPWAAFVVVSGYAWSGIYTGHAQHVSWLVGFSALPYVIWRLDRALTTRTWLPAVQSGAIWGGCATGAYPGVTIVTAMLMIVWTMGRLITSSGSSDVSLPTPSWRQSAWVRGGLGLATAGLVGAVCLMPTYVSFFYEGPGVHVRRDPLPRDVVIDNNALEPGALVTSVSPRFASLKIHHRSPPLWPKTDLSSVSLYSGASVLVLGVIALALAPRSGWRWFLATVAITCVAIAVGSALPLRGWLYDWVYPTRFFRHAAMFRLYFVFTLAVLALLGAAHAASTVTTSLRLRRRCGLITIGVAVAAGVIYLSAVPEAASDLPDAALGQRHLVIVWGGMLAVGILLLTTRKDLTVIPMLLVAIAAQDAVFTATLTRLTMYSATPGDIAWWRGEAQLHDADVDITRRGLLRTLRACELNPPCTEPNTWGMITKVPAASTYTTATNPFYEETTANALLADAAIGPDRLWFSPRAERVGLDFEMFRQFLNRARALGGIPIVVHDRQSMLDPTRRSPPDSKEAMTRLPRAERMPATIERYRTNTLRVTVEAPSAGWLLVTDRWARSWRATVDGRAAPVLGGNFVFRAVELTQGRHRIDFSYKPLALPWLLVTSWMTIVVVAVASVVTVRHRRA